MFAKVRPRPDDKKPRRTPQRETEQAPQKPDPAVEQNAHQETAASPLPSQEPTVNDQSAEVPDRQVTAYRRPPLLDLLEPIFKRKELAQLRNENEALGKYNDQLQKRQETEDKTVHAHLRRKCSNRQVRDLWIAVNAKTAQENLVADFVRAEQPTFDERIILVADAKNAAHLNWLVQENRVDQETFDPNRGMAHNRCRLYVGDRVRFCRDDAELDVKDGDLGEIIAFQSQQRTLAVALDRREVDASTLVFVALDEYHEIDLGYATTYDQAPKLQLYQAFVLADPQAPTRQLVDSLHCFRVEIHSDKLTACVQFPDIAGEQQFSQSVDQKADPLAQYRRDRD